MCFDYDGYCEVWNESIRKARKEHRCIECGGTIQVGESYQYVFSVYEGNATTDHTCMKCVAIRAEVQRVEESHGCHGSEAIPPYGELGSALYEASYGGDGYGMLRYDKARDEHFVKPIAAHLIKNVTVEI